MPYLNLDPNYPQHPKTIRLKGLLGDTADIYPVRLWAYCARVHPKDGLLKGYSAAEIEAVIGWLGAKNSCVVAMTKIGFLKRVGNGYGCVDWRQHEGHLEALSRRSQAANKERWRRYRLGLLKDSKESDKDSLTAPPALPANPTNPSKPVPIRKAQARTGAGETATAGVCSYNYPDGVKCTAPREPRAFCCREHIEKFRELKDQRRGDGFHQAGDILNQEDAKR